MMSDKANRSKPIRKRASNPKSRNGCITCKIRRVKCGEERPICIRCQEFDVRCDGYKDPPKVIHNRELVPRGAILSPNQQGVPVRAIFESSEEYRYFRIFETDIAEKLHGPMDNGLWSYLMLQACHDEAFVKYGVVAISAISKSKVSAATDQARGEADFALRQYGKAIRSMRTSLSRPGANTRKALIGCLLVCCFESLTGHHINSTMHARAGIDLLRNWLKKHPPSPTRPEGIVSPEPTIIEDKLVQIFARLDHQILGFFDPRPRELHEELKDLGSRSIEQMPEEFYDLPQARHYLTLIGTRIGHLFYSRVNIGVEEVISQGATQTYVAEQFEDGGRESNAPQFEEVTQNYQYLPPPQEVDVEQHNHLAIFEQWHSSFQPLSLRMNTSTDMRKRIMTDLLTIEWTIARVILLNTHNSCTYYDYHLPDFKKIIDIAKPLVDLLVQTSYENMWQQRCYSFDQCLTPYLHLVVKFCRDRLVRREAISLLRKLPFDEGVWDSQLTADMGEQLMAVEEEGVETYEIPQKARVTAMKLHVDVHTSYAEIRCTRGFGPDRNEVTMHLGKQVGYMGSNIAHAIAFNGDVTREFHNELTAAIL